MMFPVGPYLMMSPPFDPDDTGTPLPTPVPAWMQKKRAEAEVKTPIESLPLEDPADQDAANDARLEARERA